MFCFFPVGSGKNQTTQQKEQRKRKHSERKQSERKQGGNCYTLMIKSWDELLLSIKLDDVVFDCIPSNVNCQCAPNRLKQEFQLEHLNNI